MIPSNPNSEHLLTTAPKMLGKTLRRSIDPALAFLSEDLRVQILNHGGFRAL